MASEMRFREQTPIRKVPEHASVNERRFKKSRFFIKQLSEAIKYLHSSNKNKESIVHRDLKLENIIIDDRNNLKIIDMGFSVAVAPG